MLTAFLKNKYKRARTPQRTIPRKTLYVTVFLILHILNAYDELKTKTNKPPMFIKHRAHAQPVTQPIKYITYWFEDVRIMPYRSYTDPAVFNIFYIFILVKKYRRKWFAKLFTTLYNKDKQKKKNLLAKIPRKRKRRRRLRLIKGKWRFIKRFLLKSKRRRRVGLKPFLLYGLKYNLIPRNTYTTLPQRFLKKKRKKLRRAITIRRNFLIRKRRYHQLVRPYKLIKTTAQKTQPVSIRQNIKLRAKFKFRAGKPQHKRFVKIKWTQIQLYKTKRRRSIRNFKWRYINWKRTATPPIIFVRTRRPNLRRFSGVRKKKKQRLLHFLLKKKKVLYKTKRMFKILRRQFVRKTKFKTKKMFFSLISKKFNIWQVPRKYTIFFKLSAVQKNFVTTVRYFTQPNLSIALRKVRENAPKHKTFTFYFLFFRKHKIRALQQGSKYIKKAQKFIYNSTKTKKKSFKKHFFRKIFNSTNRLLSVSRRSAQTLTFYLNTLAHFTFKGFTPIPKNKRLYKTLYFNLVFKQKLKSLATSRKCLIYNNQTKNDSVGENGMYTNHSPLFFFKIPQWHKTKNSRLTSDIRRHKLRYLFLYIKDQNTNKYKNFFIFFLLNFLENFLKKKIWIRVETGNLITKFYKHSIIKFCKNNARVYWRFLKLISVKELMEILVLTFKTHDLDIFLTFIRRCFEKSHFKKHRKILSIMFDVIRRNKHLFMRLGIKGFSFDIRGKVGVSGNAKKRHVFFSFGKISNTSQNLKSYWKQTNVWTPTGQMGITCLIQY